MPGVYIIVDCQKPPIHLFFTAIYIYIYIYFDIFCCEKLLCVFHSNIYLRRMAPTALPLAGFQLLFYDFFFFLFIYVFWDLVFLPGKLLYLELC